jgi:hypothetical protein
VTRHSTTGCGRILSPATCNPPAEAPLRQLRPWQQSTTRS